MSHVTHIGIKRGWCQPGCSCGWPGKPTRGAGAAEAQLDVHLAAVGQPAAPEVWARRYLGGAA
jgi:hypothetical protein